MAYQEIKVSIKDIPEVVEELKKADETIKGLQENQNSLLKIMKQYEDYKLRVDKAIEYIENNDLYEQDYDYDYEENMVEYPPSDEQAKKDLLEILKGSE